MYDLLWFEWVVNKLCSYLNIYQLFNLNLLDENNEKPGTHSSLEIILTAVFAVLFFAGGIYQN